MSKRKASRRSGVPVKLTGAQLVTLRLVLAHHLWEHPHDDEIAAVLRSLPPVNTSSHFTNPRTLTLRIQAGALDSYTRAFKLAGDMPHTPPGVYRAMTMRAAKLEEMSAVERLGKVL